ncbi:hypothetical protein BGZ65_003624, partial [Modicella reniformis]
MSTQRLSFAQVRSQGLELEIIRLEHVGRNIVLAKAGSPGKSGIFGARTLGIVLEAFSVLRKATIPLMYLFRFAMENTPAVLALVLALLLALS